jgi:hypothetical protein
VYLESCQIHPFKPDPLLVQSEEELQLGGFHGGGGEVWGRAASDCSAAKAEIGDFGGLGWIAEASISEEPGAEKLHAGIVRGPLGR